jgi:predicted MFS family arabinose efflux permease
VIPVLAEGVFAVGAVGMGWLMAAFGTGMFIGTIVLSVYKIEIADRVLITLNFILIGIAFAVIGFSGSFYWSLASCALVGFCLNLINIKLIVLYQMLLPPESRGKVMAVITALALSSQPISYGVTGYILDKLDPLKLMVMCGMAIIVVGMYVYSLKSWRIVNEQV